jgi:hypothetical protein
LNDSITLNPAQEKRAAKTRPVSRETKEAAQPIPLQPIRTRLILSCGWPDASAVPAKRVAKRAA